MPVALQLGFVADYLRIHSLIHSSSCDVLPFLQSHYSPLGIAKMNWVYPVTQAPIQVVLSLLKTKALEGVHCLAMLLAVATTVLGPVHGLMKGYDMPHGIGRESFRQKIQPSWIFHLEI